MKFRFLLPLLLILSTACALKNPGIADPSVVMAYTSGFITPTTDVRIAFGVPVNPRVQPGTPAKDVFHFSPSIAGKATWLDASTLVFHPDHPLPQGQRYLGVFDDTAVNTLLHKRASFGFHFTIARQRLRVSWSNLLIPAPENPSLMSLQGNIDTAFAADPQAVEKMLTLNWSGPRPLVTWTHSPNGLHHVVTISNLQRGTKDALLTGNWNAGSLGSSQQGRLSESVPAKDSFCITGVHAVDDGSQYVEVGFSQPLQPQQDLRGLVQVNHSDVDLSLVVKKNLIKVYPQKPWTGPIQIEVQRVQSITDQVLAQTSSTNLTFGTQIPDVRFVGKGVILPTSQGLTLPIETKNLNSILVEALLIYGNNLPQFLQVNNLAGNQELRRVGKVVWRHKVDLNWKPEESDRYVRRGLDLTPLVTKYPNGMFMIKVYYRRQNVEYNGESGHQFDNQPIDWDPAFTPDFGGDNQGSGWDFVDNENESSGKQRDNPLTASYYAYHNTAKFRSVLVSNIGLQAKREADDAWYIFAADLRTTKPLKDAKIRVLDYQNQQLVEGTTDENGICRFPAQAKPYLILAQAEHQMGYLRVDDGSALSVSQFPIGGVVHKKGLDGFIYGERGVWRPGDTIHLTFILSDPLGSFPAQHPVVLELTDPNGQMTQRVTKTENAGGMYNFDVASAPDAPTGTWTAKVLLGGLTFQKQLKIETVKPNRLKIDLNLGSSQSPLNVANVSGVLSSQWLAGGSAAGLKSDVNVYVEPIVTTFPGYEDFIFDDPSRSFQGSTSPLYSGNLDNNGQAKIQGNIPINTNPPGRLKATFTTRVFEPSGNFSIQSSSRVVDPYPEYVGIKVPEGDKARGMLLVDKDHILKIVVLDPSGNPVPSGTVHAELLKLNWRWWWEKSDDQLASYVANQSAQVMLSGDVPIHQGYAEWKFRLAYPEWGRYLIRVKDLKGNHSAGKVIYMDWPGWAGRAPNSETSGANMLSLTTEKKHYKVGDRVTVSIPSNPAGRALVVLESHGRIVHAEWLKPGPGSSTAYTFTAEPGMAPNVFVHVTFLQPHLQTANDLPIRLYGILPIEIDDPQTRLEPVVEVPQQVNPESDLVVRVSEANGRPMDYTLAVVDEGLLGITGYQTPNPWDHFYQKEASVLKSWDLYDFVAGAWSGQLDQLLTIGGDGSNAALALKKPSRFQPVVIYLPPKRLAAGAVNVEKVTIPRYLGAVRVMVVAVHGRAYGMTEKSVEVSSPLMVFPTLPRVLSPEETLNIPIAIFAKANATGLVRVEMGVDGHASILGPSYKTVVIEGSGEVDTFLRLKVGKVAGPVTFKFMATSGQISSFAEKNLEVRLPQSPQTQVVQGPLLSPGQSWAKQLVPYGYPGTQKAVLELASIPPINLTGRLSYLIHYPYGCIEQTTSSVFPQLYLDKLASLSDQQKQEIQNYVTAGIQQLQLFQTSDGGFSFWPGEPRAHPWGTNYAGQFLTEARKLGYAVPDRLWKNWLRYQTNAANEWEPKAAAAAYIPDVGMVDALLEQAYRLFTLANADHPEMGAMNRLKEQKLPTAAAWYLAAAYALAGQKQVGQDVANAAGTGLATYRETGGTFGSLQRDKAVLLTCSLILGDWGTAGPLVRDVAENLGSTQWESTQTLSFELSALGQYYGAQTQSNLMEWKTTWRADPLDQGKTVLPLATQKLSIGDGGELVVTNTGSGSFTPRVTLSGVPLIGREQAQANGLSLAMSYTMDTSNVDFTQPLPLGKDIQITAVVTNNTPSEVDQIVLSQLMPTGWEISNARLTGGDTATSNLSGQTSDSWDFSRSRQRARPIFDYQDIRDDRIYTHFSLAPGEVKTFNFRVNNTYQGHFYLPAVRVEAMYNASLSAVVPGQWITISAPGTVF
jgi:uncharacterized protein YfaS (alpha-2-macroglobulin family)